MHSVITIHPGYRLAEFPTAQIFQQGSNAWVLDLLEGDDQVEALLEKWDEIQLELARGCLKPDAGVSFSL